jgi:hypothetical protein
MGICFLGLGDCDSVSKVDISDITENNLEINNSIKNIINQNCKTIASQSNVINVIGSKVVRLNASQKNSFEGHCIMQSILSSDVDSSVQDKLIEKIKNNLETSGGLLGSPAKNDTVADTIKKNKTSIDNSQFNQITKDCLLNIDQENLLNIIGSEVEDSKFDQVNDLFLKCLSEHSNVTKVSSDFLQDTQQEKALSSTTESGDVGGSLGKAVKGLGEGISEASKGIGEGTSEAAKGVGEGIGEAFKGLALPSIIITIVVIIVGSIFAYFALQNPAITKNIKSMYPIQNQKQ